LSATVAPGRGRLGGEALGEGDREQTVRLERLRARQAARRVAEAKQQARESAQPIEQVRRIEADQTRHRGRGR